MIIKVCGMRDKDNIHSIENLGIDIMGFIFYDKSPRYFNNGGVIDYLPQRCKKAGVFVDMDFNEVISIAKKMGLDYIQLHGNETPLMCMKIKDAGYDVIKAFHIASQEDINAIDYRYHNFCKLFLFDTKCTGYGGSGKKFNWSILENYKGPTPFLLSGGLGPETTDELRNFKNQYYEGVDLNSKFEVLPGIKKPGLLKKYITEIKKINSHE